MMNWRTPLTIISAIVAATMPALAAAERLPARFGADSDERYFPALIEFPEMNGDVSVMMSCETRIETSGKMQETGCMLKDQFNVPFFKAIQKAAKKARMIPATFDGRKMPVVMEFRVEFIKEGDSERIFVYPNPGDAENIEAYGKDHVAAQRVIGREAWMKACPGRAGFGLFARAHVREDGVATTVNLTHMGGIQPPGDCQQAISDTILNSQYAPAMVDGEAVQSAYVEPFSN